METKPLIALILVLVVVLVGIFYLFLTPSQPSPEEEQPIRDTINNYYQDRDADISISDIKITGDTAMASVTVSKTFIAPTGVEDSYFTIYDLVLKKSDGQWEVMSEEYVLGGP